MLWDQAPKISVFRDNTVAFIDDLPADAISNAPGDSDYGPPAARIRGSVEGRMGRRLRRQWVELSGCPFRVVSVDVDERLAGGR